MDFNNNLVPLDFPSPPHLKEAMQNKEVKRFCLKLQSQVFFTHTYFHYM
jgi:hypothetical protein